MPKEERKPKFNFVDLVIVVIIAALVAAGVYKLFIVNTDLARQNGTVEFGVYVEEVRMPTVESMQEGQLVRDVQTNIALGRITRVEYSPFQEPVYTTDGRIVMADVPNKFDVVIYVESLAVITDNSVMIGNKEIKTGGQISVKSNIFSVTGVVYGVTIYPEN
jgi:hypothetical protein